MSDFGYIIAFAALMAFEWAYIGLARRLGVVDVPNKRSSHVGPVVRGGGVVFLPAVAIWLCMAGWHDWRAAAGLCVLGAVSFADDLRGLGVRVRLVAQFAGVCLMLWGMDVPWAWWPVALVLGVGFINAFNFMDGINGSAGLYFLVTMLTLAYINIYVKPGFCDAPFLYVAALTALVFCFFNFRAHPVTFAGDVGSILMGAMVFYALARLVAATGCFGWLALVAVYGCDATLTIVRRLAKRQNIFQAHRMHAYQMLCNELGLPHLAVAAALSTLQLAVSVPMLVWGEASLWYLAAWIVALTVAYAVVVKKSAASHIDPD